MASVTFLAGRFSFGMSYLFTKAVFEGPKSIKGSRLTVLSALAEWANDDGLCWYPLSDIADRARLKVRATQYVLKQLEECGYLRIEHGVGRGNSSTYCIHVEALVGCSLGEWEKRCKNGAKMVQNGTTDETEKVQNSTQMVQNGAEKVQNHDIKGAKSGDMVNHHNHQLTVINHHTNAHVRAREGVSAGSEDEAPQYQSYEEFFSAFWDVWKHKIRKKAAELAGRALEPRQWTKVIRAADHYQQSSSYLRGYHKEPQNFLLDFWEDYVEGPIIDNIVSAAEGGNSNGNGRGGNGHGTGMGTAGHSHNGGSITRRGQVVSDAKRELAELFVEPVRRGGDAGALQGGPLASILGLPQSTPRAGDRGAGQRNGKELPTET